jgi:hypothetical protein
VEATPMPTTTIQNKFIPIETTVIELPWLLPALIMAGMIGTAAIGYWLVRGRDR